MVLVSGKGSLGDRKRRHGKKQYRIRMHTPHLDKRRTVAEELPLLRRIMAPKCFRDRTLQAAVAVKPRIT
jgi:hypothetical protein